MSEGAVPFLAADCDTCAEDGTTDYHDSYDHAQYHGGKNGMVPQENTDSPIKIAVRHSDESWRQTDGKPIRMVDASTQDDTDSP